MGPPLPAQRSATQRTSDAPEVSQPRLQPPKIQLLKRALRLWLLKVNWINAIGLFFPGWAPHCDSGLDSSQGVGQVRTLGGRQGRFQLAPV